MKLHKVIIFSVVALTTLVACQAPSSTSETATFLSRLSAKVTGDLTTGQKVATKTNNNMLATCYGTLLTAQTQINQVMGLTAGQTVGAFTAVAIAEALAQSGTGANGFSQELEQGCGPAVLDAQRTLGTLAGGTFLGQLSTLAALPAAP
jgi:hypothetical protein